MKTLLSRVLHWARLAAIALCLAIACADIALWTATRHSGALMYSYGPPRAALFAAHNHIIIATNSNFFDDFGLGDWPGGPRLIPNPPPTPAAYEWLPPWVSLQVDRAAVTAVGGLTLGFGLKIDTPRRVFLVLPHWLLSAICLLLLVLLWGLRRPRPFFPGLCPHCGYDLRATPGRCPECGHATHPPHNS